MAFGSFYIYDDRIEYVEIKQTSPIISGFYYVNEENIEIAKKHADNGIAAAQYCVGLFCDRVVNDFVKAKEYMKLAAEQGYFYALEWISRNDCSTFKSSYFDKTLAKAEEGDISYQFLLGNYYRRNRNISEAEYWLKIVSQSNCCEGMRTRKIFEKYDYYFIGDGINKTPLLDVPVITNSTFNFDMADLLKAAEELAAKEDQI